VSEAVETINVDVLIIGGGFAGAWAALNASTQTASVLLVDKAFVSRSGASTMSGGVTTCPLPSDDLSLWANEFVTHGDYMCNYTWTMNVLEGQIDRINQLAAWDVPISRDENGAIKRFSSRGMIDVRCMQYSPKKAMEALRANILARGVRVMDRVYISDLITSDGEYPTKGSVCGAFGFYTRGQGGCVAIIAKRTIVCTGPMVMKGRHHIDNDTGDGIAMSYRAGARLVDLEFSYGGTFSVLMKHLPFGNYNVALAHGAKLINTRGERFMERYDPIRLERSELSRVIAAFAKELIDGRGPVYVDLRGCDEDYWESLAQVGRKKASILLSNRIPNPRTTPLPVEPTWGLWNGTRSGLKIDTFAQATVPGLFSAGGCSKNEATGTHSSAGVPTAYAMNTGFIAGGIAASQALRDDPPKISQSILRALTERAMGPLRRAGNNWDADRIHTRLARMEGSVVEQMQFTAERLGARIAQTVEISETIDHARAQNIHDLVKLHEASAIAENARLVYMASADRTESREQFYRQDYPETDNHNWFCWHGVTQTPSGPVFDRERIPLELLPMAPVLRKENQVSPIHAIFSGNYVPENYS
jgi:succinate dehydrogenase / fumarate reductase flavoprotein subunit